MTARSAARGIGHLPPPAAGAVTGPCADEAAFAPQRVTDSALSWLHAHRAYFRLPAGVTEPGTDPDTTLKPLGELAQLSLSIARAAPPGGRAFRLARALLLFAWRQTGRGELFVELARAEPHAVHPLEMYVPFSEAGLHHPAFERLAAFQAGTRSWAATEHEPTRRLSVLRAEARLGIPPHADTATALRETWLGGLPEPWAFDGRSGYALTHHVFHATDWGSAPAGLSADLGDYLTLWLPAWLDCCLEEERWDLAGELLAACACLPRPVPAHREWRRYAAAQGRSGVFADAGEAPDGPDHPDGPVGADDSDGAGSRAVFFRCYHPTLVGAFAGALAAARNPMPRPDGERP